MRIALQRLSYFEATVEAGSIRTAARRLGVAASAVGRQISLLEAEVGGALLDRSRAGITPTELGLLVMEYSRRLAALDRDFQNQLSSYQNLESGQVKLCVGEGFVSSLIADALNSFSQRYAGIALELDTGSTGEIINKLLENEAHIGLMYQGDAHPELHFWYSSPHPLMAILTPDHALAALPVPLPLSVVAQHPMVLWRKGHGVRHLVDDGFRIAGVRPTVGLETNSLSVLKHAVRTGQQLTLLPACSVAAEIAEGALVALPLDSQMFSRAHAHLVTRVGRRMPRAGLQLLRHLGRWMRTFRAAPDS